MPFWVPIEHEHMVLGTLISAANGQLHCARGFSARWMIPFSLSYSTRSSQRVLMWAQNASGFPSYPLTTCFPHSRPSLANTFAWVGSSKVVTMISSRQVLQAGSHEVDLPVHKFGLAGIVLSRQWGWPSRQTRAHSHGTSAFQKLSSIHWVSWLVHEEAGGPHNPILLMWVVLRLTLCYIPT